MTRIRRFSRTTSFPAVGAAFVLAATGIAWAAAPARAPRTARPSATAAATTDWTVYHRFADGSGAGPIHLNLDHLRRAWRSPSLQGQLYGEPLVFGKGVFVATEDDTAYELSASSGKVLWRNHLATPVPSSDLPCGNISPTVGVTGTPVIDAARKEIFLVADELLKGKAHHELYGLSTSSGKILFHEGADPPHAYVPAQLQRTAVALDKNRVIFGFGGNDGDCSTYHGWVESVPVGGGTAKFFEVDRAKGDDQGAIWMGGAAPAVLRNGDVFVAAGNGSVDAPGRYDDSDSVLELSPTMRLLQFFAPSDWYSDNANDRDLGSSVPAVLGNGLVVQAGKSQTVYLLRARHLGGIDGQITLKTNICGTDVDGGVATTGSTVYEPCRSGVIAFATDAKRGTIRQLWQTSTGAGGPPITAGGRVWTISGSTLYGLSPKTGKPLEQAAIASNANDFPTPSVGDGLLLAPSSNRVYAFR